jgi:hypothetical protein
MIASSCLRTPWIDQLTISSSCCCFDPKQNSNETMRLIHPDYCFSQIERELLRKPHGRSQKKEMACLWAHFGTSFEVCSELWWRLEPHKTISKDTRPHYILWMLMWAKMYLLEATPARLVGGVDKNYFKNVLWSFWTQLPTWKPKRYIVLVCLPCSTSTFNNTDDVGKMIWWLEWVKQVSCDSWRDGLQNPRAFLVILEKWALSQVQGPGCEVQAWNFYHSCQNCVA